ncbi:unnamed protein product [Didymodactylos carnosus]|uniref:Uncharacterized protein n=1 Tax=Didymodactylos carnosus TaxID=1234261 RepID=A0A813NMH4_9BILA|nr:unnamed protein product [Didymodactylos carnosus]CAF1182172.1 unnamed protein product [Didymodactylos carnosus]CAF3516769.1 unnamed protein product [Didymodactylos carnosus]CAF3993395.1 unnamed protein product [Didymodactylos carnosus]
MPGEYQPFSGLPRPTQILPRAQPTAFLPPPPPRRSTLPARRAPSSNSSIEIELPPRRRHRFREKSIITIPFPSRPTLFLRPPRRILEIERVRSRRRYEYVTEPRRYEYVTEPQVLVTNPITVHVPSSSSPAPLSSPSPQQPGLTAAMIENLPKRVVHLQPIHLGAENLPSQNLPPTDEADLDTVTLPVEYIGPDGTLSILQAGPDGTLSILPHQTPTLNIPQMNVIPAQEINPQPLLNYGNTDALIVPSQNLPVSNAELQQFLRQAQQLFQRIGPLAPAQQPSLVPLNVNSYPSLSQNLPLSFTNSSSNLNPLSQFAPSATPYNPQSTIPSSPLSATPYNPRSTIPSSPLSATPYNPQSTIPSSPLSATLYNPQSTIPSSPLSATPYNPPSTSPYNPPSVSRYNLQSTTSPNPSSATPYNPPSTSPYNPPSVGRYNLQSTTSSNPSSATPYNPPSITPYNPPSASPYNPPSITPYNPPSTSRYNSSPAPLGGSSSNYLTLPSSSSPQSNSTYGISNLPSYPTSANNQRISLPNLSNPVLSNVSANGPYQTVQNDVPRSILRPTTTSALTNASYSHLQPSLTPSSVSKVSTNTASENKNVSHVSKANRHIDKKYVQLTAD